MGGVEVQLHSVLSLASDGISQFYVWAALPPHNQWIGSWVHQTAGPDALERNRNILPPATNLTKMPLSSSPYASHYTDWAIMAHISSTHKLKLWILKSTDAHCGYYLASSGVGYVHSTHHNVWGGVGGQTIKVCCGVFQTEFCSSDRRWYSECGSLFVMRSGSNFTIKYSGALGGGQWLSTPLIGCKDIIKL